SLSLTAEPPRPAKSTRSGGPDEGGRRYVRVYESKSIGQEDLRQVQGHPPQGSSAGDLRKRETQAAPRVKKLRASSYELRAKNGLLVARGSKLVAAES